LSDRQRNDRVEAISADRSQELQSAQRRVVRIAVKRIRGGEGLDGEEIDWEEGIERPIQLDDILYAFAKGAVGATPQIIAPWAKKIRFAETTVYIRTAVGLYRTPYGALKAFKLLLPESFEQASRSVLANLAHVDQLQLRGGASRKHTLTFAVEINELSSWGFEYLKVGREFLSGVRAGFGYPRFVSDRTPQEGASDALPTAHPAGTGMLPKVLFLAG